MLAGRSPLREGVGGRLLLIFTLRRGCRGWSWETDPWTSCWTCDVLSEAAVGVSANHLRPGWRLSHTEPKIVRQCFKPSTSAREVKKKDAVRRLVISWLKIVFVAAVWIWITRWPSVDGETIQDETDLILDALKMFSSCYCTVCSPPLALLLCSILHPVVPLFLQPLSWALICSPCLPLSACHSPIRAPLRPLSASLSLQVGCSRPLQKSHDLPF